MIHDFFTGNQSYSYTSINDHSQHDRLVFHPNPAEDTIIVESPHNTRLFIHNACGRIMAIMPLSAGYNVINISEYPAGLYFLHTVNNSSAPLIIR